MCVKIFKLTNLVPLLLVILTIFTPKDSFAQNSIKSINLDKLSPGDVILYPLNCYSCKFIASETESDFSHSGVLNFKTKSNGQKDWFVYEAIGGLVRITPLTDFISRKMFKNTTYKILRNDELSNKFFNPKEKLNFSKSLDQVFNQKYKDKPFDHHFLWDDETLYCSELLAKLLNNFLEEKIIPLPMDFSKHFSFWQNYFKGKVPQGEIGIAPADFDRNANFFSL